MESSISRRTLLGYGSASAAVLLGTGAVGVSSALSSPRPNLNPFTLGVASGDPGHSSVVLWTRLAPEPFDPDGTAGMSARSVRVDYEVANDDRFQTIVARGNAIATAALGHSVHPEVKSL